MKGWRAAHERDEVAIRKDEVAIRRDGERHMKGTRWLPHEKRVIIYSMACVQEGEMARLEG